VSNGVNNSNIIMKCAWTSSSDKLNKIWLKRLNSHVFKYEELNWSKFWKETNSKFHLNLREKNIFNSLISGILVLNVVLASKIEVEEVDTQVMRMLIMLPYYSMPRSEELMHYA